jgi:hypothetical protein
MRRFESFSPEQNGPPIELNPGDIVEDRMGPCILAIAKCRRVFGGVKYVVQHIIHSKRDELEGLRRKSSNGEVRVLSGTVNGRVEKLYDSGQRLRSWKEIKRRY